MKNSITTKKKKCGFFRKMAFGLGAISAMIPATAVTALADFGDDDVTIQDSGVGAGAMMGKIIGILLTITRFVGVALVVYGVYEIVMSFMQNQPEAKTKGIIMALAGIVMTALKTILSALDVIA